MRKAITSVSLALAALIAAPAAQAEIVADFVGDFQAGTPSAGWSYLWNANGPLSTFTPPSTITPNIGQWSTLSYDVNTTSGGGYEAAVNATYPDPAPASFLRVTSGTVRPGQPAAQDASGIQRYAILAYTFSAAEVAAYGSDLFFETFNFAVPENLPGGRVDVQVFKNEQLVFTSDFLGGFEAPGFSDAMFGGHYSFGTVQADDTLYIAIGTRGAYAGEPIGVAYTLALTPEPGTLATLAVAPLALARRRRRAL